MNTPPWSFSSLTGFETCPRRYYEVRVLKSVTEPESAVLVWGNQVHKALEERVVNGAPLPESMAQYEPIAARIAASKGEIFVERELALTKNLTPTGWWDKDCWVRGKVDVGIIDHDKAVVLDYKTGKVKPNFDQLRLFAVLIMHHHPEVERVKSGFLWLAHDKLTSEVFTRSDTHAIWADYLSRVRRMELAYANEQFPEKPSGLCRGWCPVTHCTFWTKGRNQ